MSGGPTLVSQRSILIRALEQGSAGEATDKHLVTFNVKSPVGLILDEALGEVEKSLEKMANSIHDSALDVVVKAGEQAARLIVSLKVAYKEMLQETYERVDRLMRENLDRIRDLVQDIINGEREALLKVAERVETIVKLSPLSNYWLPLLTGTTPRFFAVDIDPKEGVEPQITKVRVVFEGNFYYAGQPGCRPTFTLNNRDYIPEDTKTNRLVFLIDVSSKDPKLQMHRYAYLKGTLKVIWKEGIMPWSWTTSEYTTLLGMLPATPGTISIFYTRPGYDVFQSCKSDPLRIHRNREKWRWDSISRKADSGWHVVRGSSFLHWIEKTGQVNSEFVSDDNDEVIWRYGRKDGGGVVQIVFTESQAIPESTPRVDKIDKLKWGESRVITAPPKGEVIQMIVFEAFSGNVFQFQPRSDYSNPLISLRQYGDTFQIVVKSAKDLNGEDIERVSHEVRYQARASFV